MSTDRRLYLVSSQPGAAATPVRASRSHLRLVQVEREPEAPVSALASSPEPPASVARPIAAPPAARPFAWRVMQVASDAAVFAVALLAGLRPNA